MNFAENHFYLYELNGVWTVNTILNKCNANSHFVVVVIVVFL